MKLQLNIQLLIMIILLSIGMVVGVVNAAPLPQVSVSLLDYAPQPVQPGQVMDVYVQLTNDGNPTSNTSLELVEEFPFTIEPTQDYERAKNLGPLVNAQTLHFRVKVSPDAQDGTETLRLRYSINDQNYIEESYDVVINTFDARIDVLSVEQTPKELVPGEEGTIKFELINHDDTALQNIDVTLDFTNSYDSSAIMDNTIAVQAMINSRLEDINRRVASGLSPLTGATPMMVSKSNNGAGLSFSSIAPIDSTNHKSIGRLDPKSGAEVSFKIQALPNVQPGIYALPLYLNYNDEENNPFHLRVDIPVRINMDSELYVQLKESRLRTTDFANKVTFVVANRGLSNIDYLALDFIENDHLKLITAPSSVYLGSLAPGESKEATYLVLPEEENINFTLQANYRDSFNKNHQKDINIPFEIINKNYYKDMSYEMSIVWIILGLVLLGLTIFVVWYLNKVKK